MQFEEMFDEKFVEISHNESLLLKGQRIIPASLRPTMKKSSTRVTTELLDVKVVLDSPYIGQA